MLSQSAQGYRLEDYAIVPIDSSVTAAIQQGLDQFQLKRPYAAIAVPGSSVFSKIFRLASDLTESEIIEQIEAEADQALPYPLESLYYDFEILGDSSKNPDQMDVRVTASRRAIVDAQVQMVQNAGLKVTVVDTEGFAMERAFAHVSYSKEKKTSSLMALVDIGTTTTNFYVFKKGSLLYSREQTFGSQPMSDETIAQQIKRFIQMFCSSSQENEIEGLWLAGGIASIKELCGVVQQQIDIPTQMTDPFLKMELSPKIDQTQFKKDAPSLSVSLGLALRTFAT